jgi:hypothetical protein
MRGKKIVAIISVLLMSISIPSYMVSSVESGETSFITEHLAGWDGAWRPASKTYNSDGITTTGEAVELYYTKPANSTYSLYVPWGSGTPYSWNYYMKNTGTFAWRQGLNQTITIHVNPGSGMVPMYSTVHDGHVFRPWYTEDGVNFTRLNSKWVQSNATEGNWTCWYTPASSYCYVSDFYPWDYTKNENFIQNQFGGYSFVNISKVATSEHGRNVTMVQITNFGIPDANKKQVFMVSRQHSVESINAPIIAAMMMYIRDTPSLQQGIHWYFIPEINPDGCAGVSTTYAWQTWNVNTNPIIAAVKSICNNIDNTTGLDVFFDWHSLGSGFNGHILYDPADVQGAILANAMRNATWTAASGYRYYTEGVDYSTAVAYCYAWHTWGARSFTPEPSQSEWDVTNEWLQNDGEQIARAIDSYSYGPAHADIYDDNVAVYTYDPMTNFRVLPNTGMPVEYLSNKMRVVSCPNEYTAGTFVVRPKMNLTTLLPVPGNLTCGTSRINSSNIDIKLVKCWYQKSVNISPPSYTYRLLVPELLLKDEALVRVTYIDNNTGWNRLRTTKGYMNINNLTEGYQFAKVYDNNISLQPVNLSANKNQQFWITVHVPNGTAPGEYNGLISLKNSGATIRQIGLTVEVLPFSLPNSPIDISIYYPEIYYNGTAALASSVRSEEQLHAEMKGMKEHGLLNPTIYMGLQQYPSQFATYMAIRADEGLKMDPIYYTAYALSESSYFDTVAECQTNGAATIDWLHTNYGTNTVYFYGPDETNQVPYASFLLAIKGIGGKTMCAQSESTAPQAANYNPPLLDMAVMANHPDAKIIDMYHRKNLSIASYGNPQAGEEKPLDYRRNFGLLLWQYNVQSSMTFAYAYGNYAAGYRCLWNDWNWYSGTGTGLKEEVFGYPITNGVVDTVQYEGFREGVNDIRYMTKLLSVCQKEKSEGRDVSEIENWVATLRNWNVTELEGKDLSAIRSQMIYYIRSYYENLTQNVITPKNQTIANKPPKCRVLVNDSDGHSLTVNFYENSTGSWIRRQKNSSVVANSTVQWIDTQATGWNTTYYWRVTANNGMQNISKTYYFTTGPTVYLISPKETADLKRQPKCRIWANNSKGMSLTVNFYENKTGNWVRRQTNSSVAANTTVQWNFTQANSFDTRYFWKVTIFDGAINISTIYCFTTAESSIYGVMKDALINTYIGDAPSTASPDAIRINSSEYYLIVSTLGTEGLRAHTLRISDYSGRIQQSQISNYTVDPGSSKSTPSVVKIPNTNKYAIAYRDCGIHPDNMTLATIQVWESNGTIKQAVIDEITLADNGSMPDLLGVTNNVFVVAYHQNKTNHGFIETIWIDKSGMINDTILDKVKFSSGQGDYPTMISLDRNTIAINAVANGGTDGWVFTYNISSSGDIQTPNADSIRYESDYAFSTSIDWVAGNIYVITYAGDGLSRYGSIKTMAISPTGKIRKATSDGIIDTLVYDDKDGNWSTVLKIQPGVFAITYKGTGGVGMIKTVNISETGDIGASVIDSMGFDGWRIGGYPRMMHINRSYYFIAYDRRAVYVTDSVGFGSTVEIKTDYDYTNYYVATNGSDIAGVGSFTLPFKTVQKAFNVSSNGDTIYVRGGIYRYNKMMTLNKQNATGPWLTIKSYNNEQAILDGGKVSTVGYPAYGIINIYDSNYIRFTNLTFWNSSNAGLAIFGKTAYLRMDNCTIDHCSGPAIYAQNGTKGISYIEIDHNWINNTLNNHSGTGGGQECVSLGNVSYIYIHHNKLTENHKINIDIKDGLHHIWIYGNKINTSTSQPMICSSVRYWGGTGIYIDARGPAINISMYNNDIWGNATGMAIASEWHGGFLESIRVYNNVFNLSGKSNGHGFYFRTNANDLVWARNISIYSNTFYGRPSFDYQLLKINAYKEWISNVKVWNNIFANSYPGGGSYPVIYIPRMNSTDNLNGKLNFSYNIFFRYGGGPIRIGWQDTSTEGFGGNKKIVDPQFVNRERGDLRINATSPARGNATATLIPAFDYFGAPRPMMGTYDIGAIEYSHTSPNIVNALKQITSSMILRYLQNITVYGGHPTGSASCITVGEYIYDELKSMGLWAVREDWTYGGYSSSNIVATINGTNSSSNRIHIICGHYDSVSAGPGSDDDGSGVAAMMAAAYVLRNCRFNDTIKFIGFSGEEQGLYGSTVYSTNAYNGGLNIYSVLNGDMIGYSTGTNNFKIYKNAASAFLFNLSNEINNEYDGYINYLTVIDAGTSGSSDHVPFWNRGYNALFYHENVNTPYYHTANDVIANMNLTYNTKAAKLMTAVLSELAGLNTSRTENTTIMEVLPAETTVTNNKGFTLNISCTPGTPIKSFEFKISFNPYLLRAVSVTEGNIFDGYLTFFNDGTIDNNAGMINDVYGLIVGTGNVTEPGNFVSISFKSRNASGTSEIHLLNAGVTNEWKYVSLATANGNVTVNDLSGIYVGTNGSDAAGNGSKNNPYKTLQKAINVTQIGDTIYLRGGNYNNVYPKTTGWRLKTNGTALDWFTVAGYPGERAVLNGNGYPLADGCSLLNVGYSGKHLQYVRVTNLIIENVTGSYDSNFALAGEAWAQSAYGGANHHIRIDNITINNCPNGAIKFTNEQVPALINNISVESCIIDNTCYKSGYMGECISLSGCKDFVVKDNLVTRCKKAMILAGCSGQNSKNGRIFGNILKSVTSTKSTHCIYLCAGTGSQGGTLSNVSVYKNLMINTNDSALCLGIEDSNGKMNNISIYNNIIYHTANVGMKIQQNGAYTQFFDNITLKHNTFFSANSGYSLWISNYQQKMKNIIIANNIFQGNNTNSYQIYSPLTNSTASCYKVRNNLYNHTSKAPNTYWWNGQRKFESTYIGTSPQFVNRKLSNFHLNATSPAINAANATFGVTTDYDGTQRPNGAGYDVGAYEYTGALSNFQISGYTSEATHGRHAADNLNFSATIVGATEVYINILTPKGATINQSLLQNHSTSTGSYWCNRNFSNGKNNQQPGYGWPSTSFGNGTYSIYIFAKVGGTGVKSTVDWFTIHPTADANADALSNFMDLTAVTGLHWGESGSNRFLSMDANGDGVVNYLDLTFITGPKNWGWHNTV